MKNKKTWNLIGFIAGIAVIIMGIVFMTSPADSYSTSSVKDASFGADFYTYVYDGVQAAAGNAAVTANNIRELGSKLALYSGALFLVLGVLITIYFGKLFFTEQEEKAGISFMCQSQSPYAAAPPAAEPSTAGHAEMPDNAFKN